MAHTKRQEALIKRYALKGVNKPKLTPKHKTKKAVVLAKTGDHKIKLIRFGAKNIAKGKSSAAYWADKFLWSSGGRKKSPPKSQKKVYGKR